MHPTVLDDDTRIEAVSGCFLQPIRGVLFGVSGTAEEQRRNVTPCSGPVDRALRPAAVDQSSGRYPGSDAARIMVVDDDLLLLRATSRLAISWGYRCETYSEPRRALLAAEESAPDLLIVDIYMPEIDGFEVIKRMRRMAGPTSILAVSGDAGCGKRTHVLDMSRVMGADAVLEKPIGAGLLRATVKRLVGPADRD
ncbi:response regulator receiver protein [Thiocapsa marina 5811]|uniref:Response regulator receiver protein n=2 Tax=Thiocapsa marina TaxID=244573 RepID=F9UG84_9GAMM|nr:response regulator receiver protein [Thiocapsa marina 5811]